MKNERVLSFKMSKEIPKKSMSDVCAATGRDVTYVVTYDPVKGMDHNADISGI